MSQAARFAWIAAAVVAVGATTALAQSGRPATGVRLAGVPEARLIERNAEKLGLDEATRDKLAKATESARSAAIEGQAALDAARKRLDELYVEPLPEEAALLERAEAMGQAWTAILKQRMRTTLAVRSLLTPEQRDQLVALRDERAPRPRGNAGLPIGPPPGIAADRKPGAP